MKLFDLQKKRGELAAQMRNLVDSVEASTGMTQDQEDKWSRMDADLVSLDGQIEKEQKLVDLEASLAIVDEPAERTQPEASRIIQPLNSAEYIQSFTNYVLGNVTPDIRAALQVGTNSEGGYTVPQSWATTLIALLTDNNVMRQISSVMTTASTHNLPVVTDNGAATWTAEEAAFNEDDPVFGTVQLAAYKLTRIIKLSEELLNDSAVNLEAEIGDIFGRTFGVAEEAAFVNGDGSGKPTGVLQTATNAVTAAGAAALTYDEIVNLTYAVREVYRNRGASFLVKSSTAGLLRKLKDGNSLPLWQPSSQAGQPDMLLGFPLRTSEAMPAATTGLKSVAFGDFSQYRIADRSGITMQRLNELYAANGQVGIRMQKRTDGKLLVAEAVQTITQA